MTDPKPTCPNCAYELSGIVKEDTVTCPECGNAVVPSTRTKQSLKYAFNFAVGLIGIPAVVVPLTAILLFSVLDREVASKFAQLFLRVVIIAPLVWVPLAFWITIRYKKPDSQFRDVSGTIAILLSVTLASAFVYLIFLFITIAIMMGA
ncbi:MAG: hypothetical protein JJ974_00640 [Phycisphaerales bacterium]|nr:hypothetical protein [Phycisphaerales bacterium]